MASMPFAYKSIIDNLIMRKTLMLEEILYTLQIKKTKLKNLGSIKDKNAYFAGQRDFCRY